MKQLLFIISVSLLGPWLAHPATVSTTAFSDSFVTIGPGGTLSANNYGAAGALALAAAGKPQGEFQSVLQFDASGAKISFDTQFGAGQWTVSAVTLQLAASPANNAIFNAVSAGSFGISWMQNDSWTEGTGSPGFPSTTGINFNTLQGAFINNAVDENLGAFAYSGATSGAFAYALGLSPGFRSDVEGGNNVSLRLLAADANVSYVFNSRNFPTTTNRPILAVTAVAVPEASTLTLAALGLGLLSLWRGFGRGRSALRHRGKPPVERLDSQNPAYFCSDLSPGFGSSFFGSSFFGSSFFSASSSWRSLSS
ncbi:MAG TPA: hypothetical protein VGK40_00525 [Verrucomicrobiae bacterium]